MSLVMTCLLCVVLLLTAEGGGGMPPFVLLNTLNTFKAGETTTLKLILFGEQRGNVTVKYYSTYGYPTVKTLVKESTTNITEKMTAIELPIEVPTHKHDVLKSSVISLDGYFEDFGWFDLGQKSLHSSRVSGYKTYVQTDKPIYKPGQTVRFRGFSVDSSLIGMMLTDGLGVAIQNPDGIEIFKDIIRNDEGVIHQGDFFLADEAKLGTYRIVVTGESHASCSFDVEEYVLPKFGVEIMGPRNIQPEDSVIKGSVSATYTYGKPVNGKVTLKFGVDNKSQRSYFGPYFFQETTTALVEGKADWEVDVREMTEKLRYLFNPWCTPSNLIISALVTNTDGGTVIKEEDSTIKFSQSSVKLSFNRNTQKNYVTGFPFYVELDVEAHSTDIIENIPVKLTMISGLSDLKYETKKVFVNDGKAYATFLVPEEACALKVTAELETDSSCEAVFSCFQPERMVSMANDFVRFSVSEPKSYLGGDNISYSILSSKNLEILHLLILTKGNIVKSWMMKPKWRKHESGKFYVEGISMIPRDVITRSVMVVVSANNANGYILADSIDICIKEQLKHKLEMSFTKIIAKPGDEINLTIKSDPKSFVGIGVNDAGLNLLREPCKLLTKDSTLDFLKSLDGSSSKDLTCKRVDPYQCSSDTEVKIIDIFDLLESIGLDLDTNMNMFDYSYSDAEDFIPYPYFIGRRGGGRGGEMYEFARFGVPGHEGEPAEPAPFSEDELISTDEEENTVKTRTYFPEAWLWMDTVSDDMGNTNLSLVAPDTITAWKGNAFGLSPVTGLGFSNDVHFTTFLPFFISIDLPYSGTVGEILIIPIRVFNYNKYDIIANVRISSKLWDEKNVFVEVVANKAKTIDYTVRLTEAGNHEISVMASSSSGEKDKVERALLVQPGGEKVVDTHSLLILEKNRMGNKTVMSVSLPGNFIPGSHKLKLVAVGDILGEAASGISNLIQLPSGCGEQNMHKVAINVFAANYLMSIYKELPENIDYNIKHNLNIGMQQQLAYRRGTVSYSGGYSIFKQGPSSDWLTAFVYKIVKKIPDNVFVQCSTVISDLRYLVKRIDSYSSGRTSSSVSIEGWAPHQYRYHDSAQLYWQSYFLISLLESDSTSRCGLMSSRLHSGEINSIGKVCNATYEMMSQSSDCCYNHMVVYSIELCKDHGYLDHVTEVESLSQLVSGCVGNTRNGEYTFATCGENLEYEDYKASSRSIEATGYAAILHMFRGDKEAALPMIMWLANQRNENCGFRSSQDTVIGLQALSMFASMTNNDMTLSSNLTIVIGKGNTYFERIKIIDENKLTTKEVMLAPSIGDYKIKWTGVGVAFVQLISQYHVSQMEYEPLFSLHGITTQFKGIPCVQVTFRLPNESSSTMFLLEVKAPTGVVFTKSLVEGVIAEESLRDNKALAGFMGIIRYDIKEGGQRIQLYVDPDVSSNDFLLHLPLDSKFTVHNRMPAQITLLDYYNPSLRETIFYSFETEN